MSVHPALAGVLILDQRLALHEWLGIAIIIITTNAIAIITTATR
jgi:threonine/homoserine efflux transporter RhtA